MPVYQELRKQHTLSTCFHTPSLAAAITCQPIEHLGVDAAILFSDILVILETLGLEVIFPEKGAPFVRGQIQKTSQNSLPYVEETIYRLQDKLTVPLIGFAGGPFTVASYMLRKAPQEPLEAMQNAMQQNPALLHTHLSLITEKTITYLQSQINAGVHAVQIFDSWAGQLSKELFALFVLPYLEKITQALRGFPVILFTRNTFCHREALEYLQPTAISFDSSEPLSRGSCAIQGNLDPLVLLEEPAVIVAKTRAMLESMRDNPGYIAGLGHGVLPQTPLASVQLFVDTVKNYQVATGGMEHKMASGLPPDKKPNFVPRS